jgi:hypothetical protein
VSRAGCGEDTKALKPGSCTGQHSRDTDGRTQGLIQITAEEVDKNSCHLTSVKPGVHLFEQTGLSNLLPQRVVRVSSSCV